MLLKKVSENSKNFDSNQKLSDQRICKRDYESTQTFDATFWYLTTFKAQWRRHTIQSVKKPCKGAMYPATENYEQ